MLFSPWKFRASVWLWWGTHELAQAQTVSVHGVRSIVTDLISFNGSPKMKNSNSVAVFS